MSRQRIVGWLLALATVIVVAGSQRSVGVARDEVVYMASGSKYAAWWIDLVTFERGISKDSITKTWGGKAATDNNREHPPLMKTLFGLSKKLLHDKLGVDETTAYRFPSALMHGLLVLLVYFMVLGLWGFAEAIVAGLLVLFLPRALFHAGLACFDAPIMTLWFATIYAYWKGLSSESRFPWYAGVVFGLALATKHNALLLPFAIAVHYAIVGYRAGGLRAMVTHRWPLIVSFVVLAPLTLFVVWPWLWFDPIGHLGDWLTFHLKHVHYNFEYLGENWNAPRFPWHVALITTLFTVPVATLVAAVTGAGVWIARAFGALPQTAPDPRMPALLLALSAAASIVPFFLGSTPIFGAEKHWMPALPTICIAAAVGVVWAARTALAAIAPRLALGVRDILVGAIAGIVILAAAVETSAARPYALTWYNALAGGAPGGADRGMNRQFWGVAARGVLPELARLAAPSGTTQVYTHDAAPAWGVYVRTKRIPRTLADAGWEQLGIDRSKLAIVIHEKHFNRHDYLVWRSYGTIAPVFVLRADGVPIVSVYRRP